MKSIIDIIENQQGISTINSYQLKDMLQVSQNTKHATWVSSVIRRARLEEGTDYIITTVGESSAVSDGTSSLNVCGGSDGTSSNKAKLSNKLYHFTIDACEMIAMLTDSDVGHAVRKQFQGYKRSYQQLLNSQLEQQKLLNKLLSNEISITEQAKLAGYRTVQEIKDTMLLRTGTHAIKAIADEKCVPFINAGSRTFYSLPHFIEGYRKFVNESERKSNVSQVTYVHGYTGLTFEHQ